MANILKKYQVGIWIEGDTANEYTRIEKSTSCEVQANVETQDYDYIADTIPTTEIIKYAPSISQSLTCYKGAEDYSLLWPMFYNLPTGANAKKNILIVFSNEPITQEQTTSKDIYTKANAFEAGAEYYSENGGEYTKENGVVDAETFGDFNGELFTKSTETTTENVIVGYSAWKSNSTLSVSSLNTVDGVLTFDIKLGEITRGYATPAPDTKKPIFTKTNDASVSWMDPFRA